MKRSIQHIITVLLLLGYIPTQAQNTATVSGNWNSCATWGTPASIIQNVTDTKTINTGVTVAQNTAWSTGNITLNGTGAVTFASSANAVDFVTDLGGDQDCCILPIVSTVTTNFGTVFMQNGTTKTFSCTATNWTNATFNFYDEDSGGIQFGGTGTAISNGSGGFSRTFQIFAGVHPTHMSMTFTVYNGTCSTTTAKFYFTVQ